MPQKKKKRLTGVKSPISRRNVLAREREARALELRIQGKTLQEIGDALGMSFRGAKDALVRALDKAVDKDTANRYRALLLGRYETLYRSLFDKFVAPDTPDKERNDAFDRIVKVLDLMGKVSGVYALVNKEAADLSSEGEQDGASYELRYLAVRRFDPAQGETFYDGPKDDEIELPEPLQKMLDSAKEVKVNGKSDAG